MSAMMGVASAYEAWPFRAIESRALYDEIVRLAPDGSVGWKDGALVLTLPGVEGELCLRSADGIELPAEYLEGRLETMRARVTDTDYGKCLPGEGRLPVAAADGAVIVRLAVTPAMIEAGADALANKYGVPGRDLKWVAEGVFRAMLAAHNEGSGS